MKLFRNKLGERISIAKSIGFAFWLIAFFVIPYIFTEADMLLRVGVLFWYTTFGAIIWVFWVIDKHPIINIKMPFWFRWVFIWAWLNFVLVFFSYDLFVSILSTSDYAWMSPFWFVIEWAMVWLFIDWISTKYSGEGPKLLK
jgi:hypothetical protein